MNKAFKTLLAIGLAISLLGCGDDDKDQANSSQIKDSLCKHMVQCEGQNGRLPSNYTPSDIQNVIAECNQVIQSKFFSNAKTEKEAADYISCVDKLDCNALHPVFTSKGITVPSACQQQYQSFINSPTTNPPTTDCNENDTECMCRKNPALEMCKTNNPSTSQCDAEDTLCQCEKDSSQPICTELYTETDILTYRYCKDRLYKGSTDRSECGEMTYSKYNFCVDRIKLISNPTDACDDSKLKSCQNVLINLLSCETHIPCSTHEERFINREKCRSDGKTLDECEILYPYFCQSERDALNNDCRRCTWLFK